MAAGPGEDLTVIERVRIAVRGAVQGVGFRPFVYRLAGELRLAGWVLNSAQGVFIEVEGERSALDAFILGLGRDAPPRASIHSLESTFLDPVAYRGFVIRDSEATGTPTALVMADIATCADCLSEVVDPSNRRYRYPFTNCTNCGPRFSIVEALPYDRRNTSMKRFTMCDACRSEYHDPGDRRFHAQPNACPVCGPQIVLWDDDGHEMAGADDALTAAAEAIRSGRTVAVKGLGGFHLVVDATNDDAVRLLRARKRREEKPLALMYPSLEAIGVDCHVSALEARLLTSPEAPIVLLARRAAAGVAPSVAPGNPSLGVMLPYTPLHHLLLREVGRSLVATSGNLTDEPICTDEHEAAVRLRGVADRFLVHNRPIVRHVDDSIARIILGRELLIRRARGYAPLPVPLAADAPPVLAVGAHLKNTIAVASGRQAFISQHVGDLETPEAEDAFRRVIDSFRRLYRVDPVAVAADLHPDYLSTKFAGGLALPVVGVQHHVAHVAACVAENDVTEPALGVSWDGTGYGPDGTIWGGEFILARGGWHRRVARLRRFQLPGGDQAVREPRRSAAGVLQEVFGEGWRGRSDLASVRAFRPEELTVLAQMLTRRVNAPWTSSVGRLFDAVASLLDLRQRSNFEGQAAMALEWAVDEEAEGTYPFSIESVTTTDADEWSAGLVVDWSPTIQSVTADIARGANTGYIATRFHHALADVIVAVARRVGVPRVVLTGGCFQNRYLTECAVRRLRAAGLTPYWHQRVPPNDGGIALGQLCVALTALAKAE